jgi:hypothetical protein
MEHRIASQELHHHQWKIHYCIPTGRNIACFNDCCDVQYFSWYEFETQILNVHTLSLSIKYIKHSFQKRYSISNLKACYLVTDYKIINGSFIVTGITVRSVICNKTACLQLLNQNFLRLVYNVCILVRKWIFSKLVQY